VVGFAEGLDDDGGVGADLALEGCGRQGKVEDESNKYKMVEKNDRLSYIRVVIRLLRECTLHIHACIHVQAHTIYKQRMNKVVNR
jgi:hypothetical protein